MTILEINDLVKSIEKEFDVKANVPIVKASSNNNENKSEEKAKADEVSIILKNVGNQKVAAIKAIQSITGLGLMDSKKMVDIVPSVIKEKICSSEAEEYKKKFIVSWSCY